MKVFKMKIVQFLMSLNYNLLFTCFQIIFYILLSALQFLNVNINMTSVDCRDRYYW